MDITNNINVKLCEDVLVEILCRCDDWKDLSRFKCVSKSWYILISQVCIPRISLSRYGGCDIVGLYFRTLAFSDHIPGTHFQNTGTKAISQDKIMLEYASLFDNTNMSSSCATTHRHQHQGCKLLDSCNGLLLFVNKSICQYYVCNPLIKQCVRIPKAGDHGPSFVYSALAFDPSKSIHYKVVRFTSFESEPLLLDIYFSDSGQWIRRFVQLDPCGSHYTWVNHSVYFSGVIHRLSYCRHLLRLDLNSMNGRAIALPTVEGDGLGRMGCIGVWKGCLCYAKSDRESMAFIWSLEDHCEAGLEWVLKYSFSFDDLLMQLVLNIKHPRGELRWFEPYAFCLYSDVIFFGTPRMILSFDIKSNSFEEVFRTNDGIRCYHPYLTVARCLVSLENAGFMHRSAQSELIPEGMEVLQLEKLSNDLDCIQLQ